MSQVVIAFSFPEIENLDMVLESLKNALNSIDSSNLSSNYSLLTKGEKTSLESGISAKTYKDKSGGSLHAGMPVYFKSAEGVDLADGSDTSKPCEGFCVSTNGSRAVVRTSGPIKNTHIEGGITITFGQELWLSGSEAGHITNVRPITNLMQSLGYATGNGSIAGGKVDIVALIRAPMRTLADI